MSTYYFSMPSFYGKEYSGMLVGPYDISEILKNASICEYSQYFESLDSFTVPLRYEGNSYTDIIILDLDTKVFDVNKNPITFEDIPEIEVLLRRKPEVYEFIKENAPWFIKFFPDIHDIFSKPNDIHSKFCMPLLSFHLSKIKPEWDKWIHLIIPSSFWSYNYEPSVGEGFDGWDSHYNFVCILDENDRYIIEQGDNYLIRTDEDEDIRFLKDDFNAFKSYDHPINLLVNAKYDWYKNCNSHIYFNKDSSEIVHILSIDFCGAHIHLFYQPAHSRIIHQALYG